MIFEGILHSSTQKVGTSSWSSLLRETLWGYWSTCTDVSFSASLNSMKCLHIKALWSKAIVDFVKSHKYYSSLWGSVNGALYHFFNDNGDLNHSNCNLKNMRFDWLSALVLLVGEPRNFTFFHMLASTLFLVFYSSFWPPILVYNALEKYGLLYIFSTFQLFLFLWTMKCPLSKPISLIGLPCFAGIWRTFEIISWISS